MDTPNISVKGSRNRDRIAGYQPLANGIYFGQVRHRRMTEPVRNFTYKTAMFFLEIQGDSLTPEAQGAILKWPGALLKFKRSDYMPDSSLSLEESVRQLAADRIGSHPTGKIFLLSNIRILNWNFNPISVYYLFTDSDDQAPSLDSIVMEVTNTPWNERSYYVMKASDTTRQLFNKQMHVSPFLPMDLTYQIVATYPHKKLTLNFRLSEQNRIIFDADLWLKFRQLNTAAIRSMLLHGYLGPIKTSAAIYRQAFALKIHSAKFHKHPDKL